MSGDRVEVSTAAVRAAAANMGDRAGEADGIAGRARAADVDTTSWGLLGLGLGLYSGYSSARTAADDGIGRLSGFLTQAQTALEGTARDYDEADQQGSQIFTTIEEGMP